MTITDLWIIYGNVPGTQNSNAFLHTFNKRVCCSKSEICLYLDSVRVRLCTLVCMQEVPLTLTWASNPASQSRKRQTTRHSFVCCRNAENRVHSLLVFVRIFCTFEWWVYCNIWHGCFINKQAVNVINAYVSPPPPPKVWCHEFLW